MVLGTMIVDRRRGFSPNRAAALGLNLVLLVNLAGAAWLSARFVTGRCASTSSSDGRRRTFPSSPCGPHGRGHRPRRDASCPGARLGARRGQGCRSPACSAVRPNIRPWSSAVSGLGAYTDRDVRRDLACRVRATVRSGRSPFRVRPRAFRARSAGRSDRRTGGARRRRSRTRRRSGHMARSSANPDAAPSNARDPGATRARHDATETLRAERRAPSANRAGTDRAQPDRRRHASRVPRPPVADRRSLEVEQRWEDDHDRAAHRAKTGR